MSKKILVIEGDCPVNAASALRVFEADELEEAITYAKNVAEEREKEVDESGEPVKTWVGVYRDNRLVKNYGHWGW